MKEKTFKPKEFLPYGSKNPTRRQKRSDSVAVSRDNGSQELEWSTTSTDSDSKNPVHGHRHHSIYNKQTLLRNRYTPYSNRDPQLEEDMNTQTNSSLNISATKVDERKNSTKGIQSPRGNKAISRYNTSIDSKSNQLSSSSVEHSFDDITIDHGGKTQLKDGPHVNILPLVKHYDSSTGYYPPTKIYRSEKYKMRNIVSEKGSRGISRNIVERDKLSGNINDFIIIDKYEDGKDYNDGKKDDGNYLEMPITVFSGSDNIDDRYYEDETLRQRSTVDTDTNGSRVLIQIGTKDGSVVDEFPDDDTRAVQLYHNLPKLDTSLQFNAASHLPPIGNDGYSVGLENYYSNSNDILETARSNNNEYATKKTFTTPQVTTGHHRHINDKKTVLRSRYAPYSSSDREHKEELNTLTNISLDNNALGNEEIEKRSTKGLRSQARVKTIFRYSNSNNQQSSFSGDHSLNVIATKKKRTRKEDQDKVDNDDQEGKNRSKMSKVEYKHEDDAQNIDRNSNNNDNEKERDNVQKISSHIDGSNDVNDRYKTLRQGFTSTYENEDNSNVIVQFDKDNKSPHPFIDHPSIARRSATNQSSLITKTMMENHYANNNMETLPFDNNNTEILPFSENHVDSLNSYPPLAAIPSPPISSQVESIFTESSEPVKIQSTPPPLQSLTEIEQYNASKPLEIDDMFDYSKNSNANEETNAEETKAVQLLHPLPKLHTSLQLNTVPQLLGYYSNSDNILETVEATTTQRITSTTLMFNPKIQDLPFVHISPENPHPLRTPPLSITWFPQSSDNNVSMELDTELETHNDGTVVEASSSHRNFQDFRTEPPPLPPHLQFDVSNTGSALVTSAGINGIINQLPVDKFKSAVRTFIKRPLRVSGFKNIDKKIRIGYIDIELKPPLTFETLLPTDSITIEPTNTQFSHKDHFNALRKQRRVPGSYFTNERVFPPLSESTRRTSFDTKVAALTVEILSCDAIDFPGKGSLLVPFHRDMGFFMPFRGNEWFFTFRYLFEGVEFLNYAGSSTKEMKHRISTDIFNIFSFDENCIVVAKHQDFGLTPLQPRMSKQNITDAMNYDLLDAIVPNVTCYPFGYYFCMAS